MSTKTITLGILMTASMQFTASAQDLLAEKPVYTLGEAKTWVSSNDETYTFITEDLEKLTAQPANTSNIYLFPEVGGGWVTDENKAIGIQGFYIDLGASQTIGIVATSWEGAAANSYDIYLTDEQPTTAILSSTPVYHAEGLGQYQSNTAVLPDGSRGRYLVFQPTDATNWGWGVKIRNISATAPQKSELTTINVSPGIVILGEPVELKIEALDQLGQAIEPVITVSENAEYTDGEITILSGNSATVTATYDGISLESVVYAATIAPEIPLASDIATPIFTNGNTEANATAGWTTAYNGGAENYGIFTFSNGEVAQGFGHVRCVFFYNSETTGAWNGNIDPIAHGYRTLMLDVFATANVEGKIEFEGTSDTTLVPATNPFTLAAGEWNHIIVNVGGVDHLNNMSIRFNEENASDLLLANIYFSDKDIPTGVGVGAVEYSETVDVYTIQGVRVLSGAAPETVKELPAGLYIVNGQKYIIR